MKASLDTNVIIHLYRAGKQNVIFDFFQDGVYIDEFIYNVELNNHGSDILEEVNKDIELGKIVLATEKWLRELGVWLLYKNYREEERQLYPLSDFGEVCAISLARTLGTVEVVTDDIKPGGPHSFLMRIPDSEIIPFAYYELIILLYLIGLYNLEDAIETYETINSRSPELCFSFAGKLKVFVNLFMRSPYTQREFDWFNNFCEVNNIDAKDKIRELYNKLKENN